MMERFALVLNDGETYSGLAGGAIVAIPETIDAGEEEEFIVDALRENTDSVITRFV